MSDNARPDVGSIGGIDLTMPNAGPIRDFHAEVPGWAPEAMGRDGPGR